MKFEIKNRWTGTVQYSCELSAEMAEKSYSLQLGFAVKSALASGSDLSDSDLRGSDLRRSDLRRSDLRRSNLSGSNLSGSNLSGSNLSGSDLRRSNLSGSDLSGSDLSGSDLSGSDLSGSDLSGSDLRSFKADLWMTLTQNTHEVPALVTALREGRVDGSTYQGPCACLVGTIANARGVSHEDLDHSASNPAERWFMMIREGDKPEDETGGGFASKMALEWSLEWCALNGIEP